MSTDRCDRYFDLEMARQLTRQLCGGASAGGSKSPLVSPYVRVRRRAAPTATGDTKESSGWERLVAECRRELEASSTFVLGNEGLLIAVCGDVETEQAQAMGARLMVGLEQASQLEGRDSSVICTELARGWVSAFFFTRSEQVFLFAAVAERPLDGASKSAVLRLLAAELSRGGL